ncbi:hypothetical protein PV326_007908, partial [Microctonus aethiopoides]
MVGKLLSRRRKVKGQVGEFRFRSHIFPLGSSTTTATWHLVQYGARYSKEPSAVADRYPTAPTSAQRSQ